MNTSEDLSQEEMSGNSPRRKRQTLLIPWYGDLPGIDEQIGYIKRVRKQIYSGSKTLRKELRMVCAIEQSLLAAKLLTPKKKSQA